MEEERGSSSFAGEEGCREEGGSIVACHYRNLVRRALATRFMHVTSRITLTGQWEGSTIKRMAFTSFLVDRRSRVGIRRLGLE